MGIDTINFEHNGKKYEVDNEDFKEQAIEFAKTCYPHRLNRWMIETLDLDPIEEEEEDNDCPHCLGTGGHPDHPCTLCVVRRGVREDEDYE